MEFRLQILIILFLCLIVGTKVFHSSCLYIKIFISTATISVYLYVQTDTNTFIFHVATKTITADIKLGACLGNRRFLMFLVMINRIFVNYLFLLLTFNAHK